MKNNNFKIDIHRTNIIDIGNKKIGDINQYYLLYGWYRPYTRIVFLSNGDQLGATTWLTKQEQIDYIVAEIQKINPNLEHLQDYYVWNLRNPYRLSNASTPFNIYYLIIFLVFIALVLLVVFYFFNQANLSF